MIEGKPEAAKYREQAERYICNVLPNTPSTSVNYTQGGLMFKMEHSNLQYVTTSTFLLAVYGKYLKVSKNTFNCGSMPISPIFLREHVRKQVCKKLQLNYYDHVPDDTTFCFHFLTFHIG